MIRGPTAFLLYGSLLAGVLFALIPLPFGFDTARPYVLALLLAYWLMEAPQRVGLGTAFVTGLLVDMTTVSLLGEHAFRLVVMAFFVQHFRARLRFFPLWQQAAAITVLLLNDGVVRALIHAIAGVAQSPWSYWLSPLLGGLLWPWLFIALDKARLRARERN